LSQDISVLDLRIAHVTNAVTMVSAPIDSATADTSAA
jgi:hypothetical protein